MLLFGHRGYSDKYPENTLLAFQKAIEDGFDGIETDVHKTKDGKLVLCHDEKINRTSNGEGFIKDKTYEELLQYDFGYKTKYKDQKIPLLKELLQLCKGQKILINIEVKTNKIHYENIELEIYQMVKDMEMLNQVIFSSFYLESLFKLREINNQLYLGYLFEDNYEENKKICLENRFHVHVKECYLDEDEIASFHRQKLDINTWDVSNRFRYSYFKRNGVNIVIANKNFKTLIL